MELMLIVAGAALILAVIIGIFRKAPNLVDDHVLKSADAAGAGAFAPSSCGVDEARRNAG